jgi:hypothetical protein
LYFEVHRSYEEQPATNAPDCFGVLKANTTEYLLGSRLRIGDWESHDFAHGIQVCGIEGGVVSGWLVCVALERGGVSEAHLPFGSMSYFRGRSGKVQKSEDLVQLWDLDLYT